MSNYETLFEAPAAHESQAMNQEFEQEFENQFEFEGELQEMSHYANPEWENENNFEWEGENEWEQESQFEWEHEGTFEWENEAALEQPFAQQYSTAEWNGEQNGFTGNIAQEIGYELSQEAEGEWEGEADPFIGKALRGLGKLAKRHLPALAKKLAPFAAKALGSMIPGAGVIAGPLLGKLAGALVKEASYETAQMEAQFFGSNEMNAEVGQTEQAHEAALTELMAFEAMQAHEAQAEALLASALPITISIMGGRRALRRTMLPLAQANGRLVRVLRQQGPYGRYLLPTVPTIQRQTVATLRSLARNGQPINAPTAVRAMALATRNVLGNPQRVQQIIRRNAQLRQRVAPPTPRRAAVFTPSRPMPFNPRRSTMRPF